ncbi:hypothetical protein ACHQM5_030292 [Ranunculus cassubicifolius]
MSDPILFFAKNQSSTTFTPNSSTNLFSLHDDTESQSSNDHENEGFDFRSLSFRLQEDGISVLGELDIQEKCSWLRSEIIGNNLKFNTPFGTRCLTYADHTASGRSLNNIESFILENVLPFYGNTHTDDSFVGRRMSKMVHESSKYIKKCMGGRPEDAILFCGSGTTAAIKRLQEVMGIAIPSIMRARVIKELKPEERWVVFIGPYEHHSNILSWRNSLAEVVEIGIDKEGLIDMEMLKRELRSSKYSNRPMLGSFSACSNVTGIFSDTRGLARLLHRHGAFACFDFAASGPYVQIDLRSGEMDGYDAVFLSPHKFVGGPGTPGILLMSRTLYHLRSSAPSTCGGGTVSYVNGFEEKDTLYHDNIEEREDAGTPAIVQKIRAAMVFWVKEYMGNHLIETQENLWIEKAFNRLLPNPNIHILGNTSVKRQSILSFLINTTSLDDEKESGDKTGYLWRERATKKDKPLHGRFVTKLLNDLFGIQARGGCACAGPYGHTLLDVDVEQSHAFRSAIQKGYNGIKPGWTRVSFVYYMSVAEFEFILAAIEFLALYGQRFLPLYSFDWKTGDYTFRKSMLKNGDEQDLVSNLVNSLKASGMQIPGRVDGLKLNDLNNNSEIEHKYAVYLQTASYVARSLPKFPPGSRLPEGVDPTVVTFRT